jgi:predicted Zn-dependent peptidase
MRHRLYITLIVALILAVLLAPAPVVAQGPAPVPNQANTPAQELNQQRTATLHRHTLPNGLQVWCYPRTGSESVAALVMVGVGARHETPETSGISHFVEHMVFTGTERWSEEEIKEIIRRRGGQWNGWTSREHTGYYAQVAAQDVDIALEWLAEVVFRPTFPAEEIESERQIIFQEKGGRDSWLINTLEDWGVTDDIEEMVRQQLFPESTFTLSPIGEDEVLERIDRAMLLEHYRTHYVPRNTVLVLVGNVDPQDVFKQAEQSFGEVEQGKLPPAPAVPEHPDNGPYEVVARYPSDSEQVTTQIAVRSAGLTHEDAWALDVLAEVLRNSLMEELRYQRGLVYSVGVKNITYNDAGYLLVSTRANRDNQDKIVTYIQQHLERIRQGDIPASKVEDARVALQGKWAIRMEDNLQRAGDLATWALLLDEGEAVPDYQDSIAAVTLSDLSRVVETYVQPQYLCIGLHRPLFTVASGLRVALALAVLVVALAVFRRVRHRARRQQAHEQAEHGISPAATARQR